MDAKETKLLLIDDDVSFLRVLRGMLQQYSDVRFATDGAAGLQIAHQWLPDLILLDAEMPELSGHEVCNRLKSDSVTQDIPVIFVTGRSSPDEEAAALDLGAADFITKPSTAARVQARVRTQLRLKQATDALRAAAMSDGLTHVANRRAFDERLNLEWRRGLRSGQPLSLLMIDLDHFKRYNDRLGHQAGDEALRAVAHSLLDSIRRPPDLAARYGGEEFAVLLPETSASGAHAVARAIQAAINTLAIEHPDSPSSRYLTLSIGVAASRTAKDAPLLASSEALLGAADAALYRAKQGGRGRIVSATEGGPAGHTAP